MADIEALLESAATGDHRALGRLLSLVEGGGDQARQVSRIVFPRTGQAWIVGITGAPGAGKSTLVDALIACLRSSGQRVAVVAVDPSSPFSGGALLGDRVRMQRHVADPGVFVRSMASRGALGGLSQATLGAVRVLDAAGWPVVVIETVGAGQVEVDVSRAADTTVVVVTPGWGDSLQVAKAGLIEAADVFAVNKADKPGADEAVRDLEQALDLASAPADAWRPAIVRTVATTGEGAPELWQAIEAHRRHLEGQGRLAAGRRHRLGAEIRDLVIRAAADAASERCRGGDYEKLVAEVADRRLDPPSAAEALLGPTPT